MRRSAQELLRVASQTERMLKKRQPARIASGQATPKVEFDLEALDAAWCGIAGQTLVAGVAEPSSAAPRRRSSKPAAPAPVERVKYTMCGQQTDLVRLATIPAAGSA